MTKNIAVLLWIRAIVLALSMLALATVSAFANFDRSKLWFTSITDEDRITLQTNLTLTGFYDAFIDGAFGPSTYRAITRFQEWNGEAADGVLNEASRRALARASDSVMSELDLQILQDERGQIELAVPRALLPHTSETSVGTAYTRPDDLMRLNTIRQSHSSQSFEDFYAQLSAENARRRVTYKTYQEGFFVVSGSLDDGFFYSLMFDHDDQSVGFTLNWSVPYAKQGSIVSLFLASFATPWTDQVVESPATDVSPALTTALPPSDTGAIVEIGNFLVFKEMPGVIGLRGEIGPSTPLDFRRAIREAGDPKVLILASEGGYVSSALLLAYEVRELGLSTYVLPETGCYSACSFVFFAGTERKSDGALGVHQVWGADADASTAQAVVSDILEAFADFGVRQEVTSAMLRTKPEDMYVFSVKELAQWGINVGDPMPDVINSLESSVTVAPRLAIPDAGQKQERSASGGGQTITLQSASAIGVVLRGHGFTTSTILAIEQALSSGGISTFLPADTELRVLFGPVGDEQSDVPYRVTIHVPGSGSSQAPGVALSDAGEYVLIQREEMVDNNGSATDGRGPRGSETDEVPVYVQLASKKTEAEARLAAQTLIAKFGPIFRGADLEVQRVDLGNRGVYFRVRVPATSLDEANQVCSELKAGGGDCFTL